MAEVLSSQKLAWVEIRRREAELVTDEDRLDFAVIRSGYGRAFGRAKKKGELAGFLSVQEALARYRSQGKLCAITGLAFNSGAVHAGKVLKCPWSASLDRIDPRMGYTFENTRWTWVIVNMGRNEWPDAIFVEACRAVVAEADRRDAKISA